MKKIILFDFDGTIADTIPTIISVLRKIAGEFGYEHLKDIPVEKFRDYKISESLKELHIPLFKLPFILKRANDEYKKTIPLVKPIPKIRELIIKLKELEFSLGILSSNKKENIKLFLTYNKMDVFDYVYAEKNIFGKARALNHFMKKNNLKSEDIIYIGDEIRDIEAALKNNIKIVAVSWGFNSKKTLLKNKPEYIIESPKELLQIIN